MHVTSDNMFLRCFSAFTSTTHFLSARAVQDFTFNICHSTTSNITCEALNIERVLTSFPWHGLRSSPRPHSSIFYNFHWWPTFDLHITHFPLLRQAASIHFLRTTSNNVCYSVDSPMLQQPFTAYTAADIPVIWVVAMIRKDTSTLPNQSR